MRNKILLSLGVVGIAVIAVVVISQDRQTAISQDSSDFSVSHSAQPAQHETLFFGDANRVRAALERNRDSTSQLKASVGGVASHHIPTAIPLLAEFYQKLRASRDVGTFVILGPDHFERSGVNIAVSRASFVTPFGALQSNEELLARIEGTGLAMRDETAFDREHSIHSQLLFISQLFPNAKIAPIIFRSSTTNEEATAFGKQLAGLLGPNDFVVASVDFSHYLPKQQAASLDRLAASALGSLNQGRVGSIDADSPQALSAFTAAMSVAGATQNDDLQTYNSADLFGSSDYTTGYVFGFFEK